MNFSIILTFSIIFTLCGCGVKSDPTYPAGTEIVSYDQKFLKGTAEKEKLKNKKNSKAK
ncbi:MAG: hypothetical protein HOM21_04415 [Halobacteriovoraceae bacterium]|nr:hypothetical protein [Halobacteriovoraceae bacterium]